jgi:hypothetical protein
MHDATRPAFGRVRAPKSRSVTRLLRTKLGRLGHHRPDNRVCEEAGLSRDDVAPLRLASCGEDETASADPARAASTTVKADVSSRSPASPARLRSRPISSVPLPRSARSLFPSRQRAAGDRLGYEQIVHRAGGSRCLCRERGRQVARRRLSASAHLDRERQRDGRRESRAEPLCRRPRPPLRRQRRDSARRGLRPALGDQRVVSD